MQVAYAKDEHHLGGSIQTCGQGSEDPGASKKIKFWQPSEPSCAMLLGVASSRQNRQDLECPTRTVELIILKSSLICETRDTRY